MRINTDPLRQSSREASSNTDRRGNKISEDQGENLRSSAIAWQAAEFEYQQKDPLWYWGSLAVALILLILAIWQKNFLFMFFVVVAEMVIIYFADRQPLLWDFKIDEHGIHIGKQKFYSYSDIDSLDIHPHAGGDINPEKEYKELVIKLKSHFSPYLKINIHRQDEEKIKAFLLKFVPEQEHPESLSDALSKLIRF